MELTGRHVLTKEEFRTRFLREQAARKAFRNMFGGQKKKAEPELESAVFSQKPLGDEFVLAKYERRNQEEIEAGF